MPGMGHGFTTSNPTMQEAFRSALRHQAVVVLLLALLLALAYAVARTAAAHRTVTATNAAAGLQDSVEPAGRRFLRMAFGCLWIFDGLLQIQAQMPIGLPSQVIAPTEGGQPHWLASSIHWGTVVWQNHPVEAAVATVWIQVGIGAWLLVAPRGRWSRIGGLVSAGWALVVWVLGEGLGGILTSSGSWLFGAPGAVLFYVVAGGLLALPESVWRGRALGRRVLRGMGFVFLAAAVVQSLPGRGFWNGRALSSMARDMSAVHQPRPIASLVGDFGRLAGAHGFAINLFFVGALATVGLGLVTQRMARASFWCAMALCGSTWVLVQDFGFFGGLGTDPNSQIPMMFLLGGGYLSLRHAPAVEVGTAPVRVERRSPEVLDIVRWLTIAAAIGVTLLGAAPMAFASLNPRADPIVAESISGSTAPVHVPAAPFSLVDQNGLLVSLSSLRGRAVLLTFLDPVCTTDCPLIAQELKQADALLGVNASKVAIVAIAANPFYHSRAAIQAFDTQEGLTKLHNWLFLTGTTRALQQTWNHYGIAVQVAPGGGMIAHNDEAFVIDQRGFIRWYLNSDPGPGTTSTKSSFASLFAGYLRRVVQP